MAAENGTAKVGPIDVEMAGHETAPDSPNAYKDLRELFRTQSFKVLRRRDSELQSLPKKGEVQLAVGTMLSKIFQSGDFTKRKMNI